MEKIFITQNEFNQGLLDLETKILLSKVKFDEVVGIARGGLPISIPLAKYIRVPHKQIKISVYNKEDKLDPANKTIEFYDWEPDLNKKILLVDDVCESGTTIDIFKDITGLIQSYNFYVGVYHWHPKSKHKPDFYAAEKSDTWTVFPWEV